ncbi:LLM class flavin-dependent oxidoreductase [Pseudonocardia pini]|uniref:LLM class flavin-dependent oxidoreductase n=1 Tax=Pseudonocardia pini TaxID=2758030 RepID=UPI0015F00023|nr:LLM class flavin-dependent oxidoreductase [Pseudonocardia pini]
MRFGIFTLIETRDGDHQAAYKEVMGQVEYAEELGFDNVWLAEHHGSHYGSMPSPQIFAAAAARATERIRIGAAVSVLPFANPVRVAEDWAMVDVLSNGRLDLGVGRGYQPPEYAMLGLTERQPVSRKVFRESLDILIGLYENETFSYQGEFYSIEDVSITPRPVQRPRPPIFVAALSPGTFDLMGEYGLDGMALVGLEPLDVVMDHVLKAKRDLAARGLDAAALRYPLFCLTALGHTKDAAIQKIAPALQWHFTTAAQIFPGGSTHAAPEGYEFFAQQFAAGASATVDDLLGSGLFLAETAEGMCSVVERARTTIGQNEMTLHFRFGGMPDKDVRESMKIFAEEVMPQFKEKQGDLPGGF